jgi:hypothetical protein
MHHRCSSQRYIKQTVNDLQHSDKDEQYALKLKENLLFVNTSVFQFRMILKTNTEFS